mmetsp:Transcript_877/g.3542  ORF Transcript_877/g.3542 Transcript_877/m.3542 type:complete len:146 (+) Transcript_877:84-521(+)
MTRAKRGIGLDCVLFQRGTAGTTTRELIRVRRFDTISVNPAGTRDARRSVSVRMLLSIRRHISDEPTRCNEATRANKGGQTVETRAVQILLTTALVNLPQAFNAHNRGDSQYRAGFELRLLIDSRRNHTPHKGHDVWCELRWAHC